MKEEEILQTVQLKSTKKRQLILSIMENNHCPLTVEDIILQTKESLPMSPSTIYRALHALVEKQVVIKHISQDGLAHYELKSHSHHHHLICTICNRMVAINGCPLKTLEENLMIETGFLITGHNLEFSGICPQCASKSK